ncbi:hypothetical protein EU527_09590 [Candidatus Thorarchaeota archaeon]|nr:MAG: hypothetical protein EU527_09590 [Candidatus Thorarchaeota archaeon]
MTNWTNKWVLMLLVGIIIQAIAYPTIWLSSLFSHPYFHEVMIICILSVGVQAIGFLVIMGKTRGEDPAIYGQGRPFQHKLREEDDEVADRKPTFAE